MDTYLLKAICFLLLIVKTTGASPGNNPKYYKKSNTTGGSRGPFTLQARVIEPEVCCEERNLAGTGLACCVGDKKSETYFIGTHICCDGVLRRRPGSNWKCCGKRIYNNDFHDCCCRDMGPCGDSGTDPDFPKLPPKVYNKFTHICCDFQPQKNKHGLNTSCCQGLYGVQFDSSTHLCCEGSVMKRKGPRCVCCNKQIHIGGVCCGHAGQRRHFPWAEPKHHKCCLGNIYDTRHQICCGGDVVSKKSFGDFSSCCNGVVYHSSLQICCDGVLRNSSYGQGSRCCGDGEINHDVEDCCCGRAMKKSPMNGCCDGVIYSKQTYVCCNDILFYKPEHFCKQECCGQVVYDAMTQICCTGNPEPRIFGAASQCCNGKIYNSGRFRCCNGRTVPLAFECCGNDKISPLTEGCCGGKGYNKDTHLCCHDRALKNNFGKSGGCCLSDSRRPVVHDVRESLCCHNKVTKLKIKPYLPEREVCCDGQIIDTATKRCCNDVIIVDRIFEGSTDCCGRKPYDNRQWTCCNDTVSEKKCTSCCQGKFEDNCHQDGCCLGVPIDSFEQRCCSGVTTTEDIHTICIDGLTVYGEAERLCEGVFSRHFPDISEVSRYGCCGHRIYKLESQVCVNRMILPKPENDSDDPSKKHVPQAIPCHIFGSDTGLCCGKVYDVTKSICCSGKIIATRGQSGIKCCGHLSFLPSKQICCTFPDRGHEVFKRQGRSLSCCRTDSGMEVYDDSTHICCNDGSGIVQLLPGDVKTDCCGGKAFQRVHNKDTGYRCDAETRSLKVINRATHMFCGPNILSHNAGTGASCCGDHLVYNPDTQVCCSNLHVIEKRPNLQCCGKYFVADTNKDICCNDRLYAGVKPAPPGVYLECCGPFLFDDAVNICCVEPSDGFPNVLKRTSAFAICCGGVLCF